MFDIQVPKEIKAYKEKIILGMTKRQLLFNSIAVALGIPLFLYGKKYLGEEITSWLVIIIIGSIAFFGYYNNNGLPAEKFLIAYLKNRFLCPSKRVYKTSSTYEQCVELEYERVKSELELLLKEKKEGNKL